MKTFVLSVISILLFTSFIYPQAIQWQQLNGPFGGTALSFASNSNGDLFAGADQNQRGVFKSTDFGLTWLPKSNSIALADRAINWITIDDSGYVIAGTGSHIGNGVYKSKDNGESWTQTSILGGTSVAQNDSGHIYVGNTGYGQYSISKDAGYTWTYHSHPSPFINCIEINDSGHIFIGGNYTGYRSTDNGVSWTNLSLPDGINSFAFAPNGDVYAGCSRGDAYNSGVYKSTDNGDSWAAVKEGFRVYASHNIVVNDNGDIIVGTWGWGIWKSTDNGNTWNQKNSGLGHFYIKSMHISNDGNVYAGLNGGGIYRSPDNCESWSQVGITVAGVKKIVINPANENLFAAVNGMSRSTDGGLTWQPINKGLISYDTKSIIVKDDTTIFCSFVNNDYGTVFRSLDNGDNWVRADTGIQNQTVDAMTVDAEGNVYAGNYYGVYKSTNNGSIWNLIGPPGYDFKPSGLAFNSNGDLFMASASSGIWRLTHGDTTWNQLLTSGVYSLMCGNNDYLYSAHMRSTDNGDNWTQMNLDWFTSSFAENSIGHLFCGTFNYGSGVWRSTDYGDTWTQINTELPIMDIRSVAVDSEDYLYAGTNGYSMFKTTTSTVTSVEEDRTIPTMFSLEQNYPNPFNPSTVISWQSPVGSHQIIKVFDVLGNEIATLVDEYKPAGRYEVEFNSSGIRDLASGIYFYRLMAGDFIQTKKMILLK
ncbi:MAG TPA: T9SS type A sorting domain-containing protein [Ignavibacteriaceae bacterium]|nr:T9SS type A sorting domain-containing protein [Ignavibacteriaceae bacterium]